jgi:hypothetical protein
MQCLHYTDRGIKIILRQGNNSCKQDFLTNEIYLTMNKIKSDVCKDMAPVQRVFERGFTDLTSKIADLSSIDSNKIPDFEVKKSNVT